MPLLKKLSSAIENFNEPYECFHAQGNNHHELLQFRKEHAEDKTVGEPEPWDNQSTHIGCREKKSSKLVGYLRITDAPPLAQDPNYNNHFHFEHFPPKMLDHVVVISHTVIEKDSPQHPAIQTALLSKAYEVALKNKKAISVLGCEPSRFPFFRVLGYRPFHRVVASPFGNYVLPLFLDINGYEALRILRSPFYELAKRESLPQNNVGQKWYMDFTMQQGSVDTGFLAANQTTDYQSALTENLSESGKKQLLSKAITLRCQFGDPVLKSDSGGRTMGFIKKGALEIRKGDTLRILLGEGDVFGEIAFILGTPRTADAISAADGTEVILLNESDLENLRNKEDKIHVWKNLAKLVASRMAQPSQT